PEAVLTEIGGLDPQAIDRVRQEAWPDVRDADELEDTLQTLVALREDYSLSRATAILAVTDHGQDARGTPGESVGVQWGPYFEELASAGRAARAVTEGTAYWVPASQARAFALIYPAA